MSNKKRYFIVNAKGKIKENEHYSFDVQFESTTENGNYLNKKEIKTLLEKNLDNNYTISSFTFIQISELSEKDYNDWIL